MPPGKLHALQARGDVRALEAHRLRHHPGADQQPEDQAADAEAERRLERRGDDERRQQDRGDRAPAERERDDTERGDRGAHALREALGRPGDLARRAEARCDDLGRQLGERAQARAGEHARPEAVGERDEQPVGAGGERDHAGQGHDGGHGTRRLLIDHAREPEHSPKDRTLIGFLDFQGHRIVMQPTRAAQPGRFSKGSSSMAASEALVFDAIRTPRGKGKSNGSLHSTKPVDLVVGLMHEMLGRNVDLDPNRVDDVVLGCVSPVGDQGADIAKTAAIKAGLPDTVAGVQLNRFCASGLEAVNIAAQKVASGWEDLVFAGGVESMSRVPMGSDGGAWAMDPETNYDTSFIPQGIGADLIATVEGFDRETVDTYAARSQERASAAQAAGKFDNSVVPVKDVNDHVVLDKDEFIRPGTTVETLGNLKPSFAVMGEMGGFDAVALQKYHWIEKIEHVHTPGNSSGIVDGASLLAIGNEKTGEELGLKARARILATAVSGSDPTIMLTGPAPASKKALAKAGIGVDDLDLVEINEAFAAVVLRFVKDMGLDMEKVNVNGGAIAMGHPLGATGAMILGTIVDELHRTGGRYGLCTLCVGGGMGIATGVEAI